MQAIDVNEAIIFDPARPRTQVLIDRPEARTLLFCLQEGQQVPAHGSTSEVTFFTVQGRGVASVGDEEVELRPGMLVHCPPNVSHGLLSHDSLVVMATIAPRPW